jgi:ubiquinone/menaquinone biosynthesis C-methylase UbiE
MQNVDETVEKFYGLGELWDKIESGLRLAGKDINSLTVDDLIPIDEFHTRGRKATREVAELSNIKASDLVLDVGCGLGGTARYLAEQYRCKVKGIDLTQEYISVGTKLTALVNLDDRVKLRHGSALDIPYEDERFDIVWTQHVQMNIADKRRFYSEIGRVLKPGGRFLFHDVFRSSKESPLFPTPWAEDASMSALETETEVRATIEQVGLEIDQWIGKVQESVKFFERVLTGIETKGLPPLGIHLILGDNAKDKLRNYARNLSENRMTVAVGKAHKA